MPTSSHTVVIEKLADAPDARIPVRATDGSACFDLTSAETVELVRGRVTLVRTGLKVRCPSGTFLEVRPRSGLSAKGVVMANAPGTIDRDYSGEVKVPLTFLYEGTYQIMAGDRIAQVRLVEDVPLTFQEGPVSPVASRAGGFGSTGR
ncbi:MAG: dUTP diphosphatase [Thermoplasmata archaeon]